MVTPPAAPGATAAPLPATDPLPWEAFEATLRAEQAAWEARAAEIRRLLDAKPLLLYGFGGKGQDLARQVRDVTGRLLHVYDRAPERRAAARAQGFAVVDAFPAAEAGDWVTVLGAGQAQVEQRQAVPQQAVCYVEAAACLGLPHLAHRAADFQASVWADREALYAVYRRLHPASRPRFLAILRFRASLDPQRLAGVRSPMDQMWLDIPARHRARPYHTVLDIGAYDGDTLRSLDEAFHPRRAIAVEANPALHGTLRGMGDRYPDGVRVIGAAAWSHPTRLRFEEVRFGMIRVVEDPAGAMEAVALDDHVDESVDVLKMDIEGAEAPALEGCARLLARWQPDLALAAYHRPADLVDLVALVERLGYGPDAFALHVGHYSDVLDDTILYVLRTA